MPSPVGICPPEPSGDASAMKQLVIDFQKCDAGRNCNHECEMECAIKVFKTDLSQVKGES